MWIFLDFRFSVLDLINQLVKNYGGVRNVGMLSEGAVGVCGVGDFFVPTKPPIPTRSGNSFQITSLPLRSQHCVCLRAALHDVMQEHLIACVYAMQGYVRFFALA